MRHLSYLVLCLFLAACGGDGFSASRGSLSDAQGGDSSSSAGSNGSGATTTAGGSTSPAGGATGGSSAVQPAGGAGGTAQGGSDDPAGGTGGDGTEPEWIPDAECGAPLVDFEALNLATHFVWESYEQESGGLCMWCGDAPCMEFEIEWDTTYFDWHPDSNNENTPGFQDGEIVFRMKKLTRIGDDDPTLSLHRGASCGAEPATSGCSCNFGFGEGLVLRNVGVKRTATGYTVDKYTGMAPDFCMPSCPGDPYPPSADATILNEAAFQTQIDVFSAPFAELEFPCSGM